MTAALWKYPRDDFTFMEAAFSAWFSVLFSLLFTCGPYLTPISSSFLSPRSVFGQQLKAAGKTKCSPQVRCCQCCFPACSGHAMNGTNNMWYTGAAQWPISLVQRPCLCSPVHHVNNVRQTAKVPTQGWILVQSKRKFLSGSHLSLWPHLCHLCIHAVLNLTQVREDHGAGPWQEPHALSGLARVLQHCPSQCSCHSSVCSGCNVGLACSQGSVPAGADPRCTPC